MGTARIGSENHCETRKSLKICYLFNINQEQVYRTKILDIDELKRRISNEWAALSHTVIEIGLYLTDNEQDISWHSFFETRCSKHIFACTATAAFDINTLQYFHSCVVSAQALLNPHK